MTSLFNPAGNLITSHHRTLRLSQKNLTLYECITLHQMRCTQAVLLLDVSCSACQQSCKHLDELERVMQGNPSSRSTQDWTVLQTAPTRMPCLRLTRKENPACTWKMSGN